VAAPPRAAPERHGGRRQENAQIPVGWEPSPDAVHGQAVTVAGEEMLPDGAVLRTLELRVRGNEPAGVPLRGGQKVLVGHEVGEPEHGVLAVLAASEKVTLSSDPQVRPRDLETVERVPEDPEPLRRVLSRLGDKHAVALRRAAPDATAKLM
jgi:hypothetical protein